jgi:hypothetical protein
MTSPAIVGLKVSLTRILEEDRTAPVYPYATGPETAAREKLASSKAGNQFGWQATERDLSLESLDDPRGLPVVEEEVQKSQPSSGRPLVVVEAGAELLRGRWPAIRTIHKEVDVSPGGAVDLGDRTCNITCLLRAPGSCSRLTTPSC